MHKLFQEFITHLDNGNKEKCVQLAISSLYEKNLDVVTLYNEILSPALYAALCKLEQIEICIWEEHVRTSIVRTIIECCYPYVVKERQEKYKSRRLGKVVVLCPPGELHEIGARMVSDFFTLCGFDTIFVGANTPQDDIVNAIKFIRPLYVAMSITNYYNLVAAKNVAKRINSLKEVSDFQLILGGQACQSNLAVCQQMNPDMVLNTFEDIKRLSERNTDVTA